MLRKLKLVRFLKLIWRGFGFYKKQIAVMIVLGFFGGFLEGVGINAVIPLFSFLTGGGGTATDKISEIIRQFFSALHIPFTLRYLLVFIFLVFAGRALVILFNNFIKIKITTGYSYEVRNRLFRKVIEADWPHLLKQKLGHLDTLLMTNVQNAEALLQSLSGTIMLLTGLSMYLIVAINISWQVTVITLALGALLFFVFRPLLERTRRLSAETEGLNREIAHFVNEHVVGMKTVKSTLADSPVVEKGKILFQQLRNLRFKVFLYGILPDSLMQPIGLMFVLILFAFSYKTPNFNVAAFAAVVYLIDKIFIYLQQLQLQLQNLSGFLPYLGTILNYEEEALLNKEIDGGKAAFPIYKAIEFKNVSFSYNADKSVLQNINFRVERGESIGIVGPSGVGKTTIVDLLLRLFKPTEGTILIDGTDIQNISLKGWRSNLGYISQDMFLLNDTIANNIKFYDKDLKQEDVREAAEKAEIAEFIEAQPKKFDTIVGERGTLLSAGQRQRIAIARVLARHPKILILDEATSALDNETEKEIQKVINKLKGSVTTFIIAHRLTTVMNTDKLLVMSAGTIVEQGEPNQLLKDSNSAFYKLYTVKTR